MQLNQPLLSSIKQSNTPASSLYNWNILIDVHREECRVLINWTSPSPKSNKKTLLPATLTPFYRYWWCCGKNFTLRYALFFPVERGKGRQYCGLQDQGKNTWFKQNYPFLADKEELDTPGVCTCCAQLAFEAYSQTSCFYFKREWEVYCSYGC